jgi:hypothetical protein
MVPLAPFRPFPGAESLSPQHPNQLFQTSLLSWRIAESAWILEQMKLVTNNVPAMEWDQVGLYASYSQDQTLQNNPGCFGDFRRRVYHVYQ